MFFDFFMECIQKYLDKNSIVPKKEGIYNWLTVRMVNCFPKLLTFQSTITELG